MVYVHQTLNDQAKLLIPGRPLTGAGRHDLQAQHAIDRIGRQEIPRLAARAQQVGQAILVQDQPIRFAAGQDRDDELGHVIVDPQPLAEARGIVHFLAPRPEPPAFHGRQLFRGH